MLHIREAVVVEGRYDKNALSQVVDTLILETAGFGIFKDRDQMALLRRAAELARESGCYKVMLLTGRRDDATLNFYRGAGFNSEDKTAFIQWL